MVYAALFPGRVERLVLDSVVDPHDHTPDVHARTLDLDGVKRPYLDFFLWASPATSADLPAAVAPVTSIDSPKAMITNSALRSAMCAPSTRQSMVPDRPRPGT